jgi:hypothetical protein
MVTWTAKRFEQKIDMKALAVFGQTRTDLIEWLGVLLLIGGGYLLFSPLLKMVLTVPSSIQTKRRRFLAGAREGLIFLFWMAAINQALSELWSFRGLRLPHPSPMREMAHKMRYLQGWFMFSPNPVMDDGTILVDAVTVDGRHIDPFSPDTFRVPRPTKPDYDLLKAQSYGYNQIWSDYYNRMHLPQNTSFRRAMKAYIYRLPERTGNPNDAVVKGEVHWLHDMNPRFGKHNSWGMEVKKLFSFTNPDPDVQRRYRAHSGEPEARR